MTIRWHADIGEEGWLIESPSGETFGMNRNYGEPERLAAILRDLQAQVEERDRSIEALVAALEDSLSRWRFAGGPMQRSALAQARALITAGGKPVEEIRHD